MFIKDFLDCCTYGLSTMKVGVKGREIEKVIFQDNTTILIDNFGDKYIAKPEKGEKFDEEKGLLVCLAKFNGISTTQILSLLDSAIRKTSKNEKKATSKGKKAK